MTTGSWIGLAVGSAAYWVTHGFFDYCAWGQACWVEFPFWAGVGAFLGGIAESAYESWSGKNL